MTISTDGFEEIGVGTTPNDGTGFTLRNAFIAVNQNFEIIRDPGFQSGNIQVNGSIDVTSNVMTVNIYADNYYWSNGVSIFSTISSLVSNASAITTLTANAAVQAGELATLTANAAVQAGELSSLISNAASQAGDLSTLLSNAAVQAGAIAALDANAAVQAGAISSLEANAAVQAGAIAALDANAAVQAGSISELYTIKANISGPTFTGNIAADNFLGNVPFTMANITHWTSNVSTLADAINQLAERIYNIENP